MIYKYDINLELINNAELKQIQLNILDVINEYCSINNISYVLAGGTLIGAIRHRGFIPWDDDIDIYMPRPDYDRFINTFNEYCCQYKVVSYEIDEKFPYAFAKVMDKKTILIENVRKAYRLGVNIDLFPIDGILIKNKSLVKKQVLLTTIQGLKILKLSKKRSLYKNLFLLFCRLFLCWIPSSKIINRIIKNARKYDYNSSANVCVLTQGAKKNKIYDKNVFSEIIECEFEGKAYKIPTRYDEYLKKTYGDYMKLPPEQDRIPHHSFKAYYLREKNILKAWRLRNVI